MIFSRVNLPDRSAHPWPVLAHNDKQIFGNETKTLIVLNNLNMGKPLAV